MERKIGKIEPLQKAWLNSREAALYCGVSDRILFEWRTDGVENGKCRVFLPFHKVKGIILYKLVEIDKFLSKFKQF